MQEHYIRGCNQSSNHQIMENEAVSSTAMHQIIFEPLKLKYYQFHRDNIYPWQMLAVKSEIK